MIRIKVINGPNLNLLGTRKPEIYGTRTLREIDTSLSVYGRERNAIVSSEQTNSEGLIIDMLHAAKQQYDAIILNAGAYTHYSYAIRDAIEAIPLPVIEVHLSDITQREDFRQVSVISDVCCGTIYGHGEKGYFEAVDMLKDMLE